MNAEIISLFKQLGNKYVQVSRIQAEIHLIKEKIRQARGEDMRKVWLDYSQERKLNTQKGVKQNDNKRLFPVARAQESGKRSKRSAPKAKAQRHR